MSGRRRGVGLVAVLLLLGACYAGLVAWTSDDAVPAERQFGAPADPGAAQLAVYVEILGIDVPNLGLQVRLTFTPGQALRGARPGAPDRDLAFHLDDGHAVQELGFHDGEPMLPARLELSLDGPGIAAYPLERLHATLRMTAQEGFHPGADAPALPLRATLWEGVPEWVAIPAGQQGGGGEIAIRLDLHRVGALVTLALALYALMVVLALAAITVGSLVFLRVRRIEATMAGFLSGMLFALPAMRFALPGTPPLGVLADRLAFLWAEIAVGIGLVLFLAAWARHGPDGR